MKRLVLSLMLVCIIAPSLFATDQSLALSARRAAKIQLLNSPCTWFNLGTLQNILAAMEAFAAAPSTCGYWDGDIWHSGYISGGAFAAAKNAVDYWTGNPQCLENYAMTMGSFGYMTDKSTNYAKNQTMSQEELNAYNSDLAVDPTHKVSLGYYFGRNTTTWATTHSLPGTKTEMVKFVTGGYEYTFYANSTETPIVLDMNGDEKLEASNGEWLAHEMVVPKEKLVTFDMNADGFDELTEWVGADDGLLVEYEGGAISAKNLFGSEGGKYRDGFEKLALLDKDGDKKLTGDELKTLKIWQDKNLNAKVDDGEIAAVSALGITEISVEHKNLVSSFVKDAKTCVMWDWNPATMMVKKEEPK